MSEPYYADEQVTLWHGAAVTALDEFWNALAIGQVNQQNFYEQPDVPFPDDPIYRIRTKPGFIFDDSFWDVFHAHRLHICHVAYYGPARPDAPEPGEEMAGVFELRFKPIGAQP